MIVATLLRVTEDEADDYRFVGDYPEETEGPEIRKDSKETAVRTGEIDEKIREEAAAREEAERRYRFPADQ